MVNILKIMFLDKLAGNPASPGNKSTMLDLEF